MNAPLTGALNEVVGPTISSICSTRTMLCLFSGASGTCYGDSGAGLIEPGPHPTVIGILNLIQGNCSAGLSEYAYLDSPSAIRFVQRSLSTPQ